MEDKKFTHPLISRLEFVRISDVLATCKKPPSIRALNNGSISIWSWCKEDYDQIEKSRFELLFSRQVYTR